MSDKSSDILPVRKDFGELKCPDCRGNGFTFVQTTTVCKGCDGTKLATTGQAISQQVYKFYNAVMETIESSSLSSGIYIL